MTIVLNDTISTVIKSLYNRNKLSFDLEKFLVNYKGNIDEKFTENLVRFNHECNKKEGKDENFNEFIHELTCYISKLLDIEERITSLNKLYPDRDLMYSLDAKGNIQVKKKEYSRIGF
jgi:predicted transcriptional regulator